MKARALKVGVFLVAMSLSFFSIASDVAAHADGFGDRAALGCGGQGCHGLQPSTTIVATLEAPGEYVAMQSYSLKVVIGGGLPTLPVQQNQGGFALASSAGSFHAPSGETSYRIQSGAATHTAAGNDQREWMVHWTAPARGTGDVTFRLSVNAVNGDGVPDPGDLWNMRTLTIKETTGAAPATPASETGGNPTQQDATAGGNTTRTPGFEMGAVLMATATGALLLAIASRRR
ncbi:MAG: hypothetical protein HY556_09130 [Euryarchaeota archaeon]|nr:hypothetical protein [Euryarchaeota archaeon]